MYDSVAVNSPNKSISQRDQDMRSILSWVDSEAPNARQKKRENIPCQSSGGKARQYLCASVHEAQFPRESSKDRERNRDPRIHVTSRNAASYIDSRCDR